MEKSKENIADIRKDYSKKALNTTEVMENPIQQFEKWLNEAIEAEVLEATAMNLSTVSAEGKPSSRIVLLKGIQEGGFIFFTNYRSRKGKDLAINPFVSLTFFWPELERQVRIEGSVEKVSSTISDNYFSSRPRGSKIGAWASPQSNIVESREILEKQEKQLTEDFEGKEINRPEHWGGYIVKPNLIEFWQGRPSRLHDRICYILQENNLWKICRLAP